MKVGIVGGGILGLTLGYYLSRAGYRVTILEKEERPGGLAGYMDMDDVTVDKYYHGILVSDRTLLRLIYELGLGDKLKFKRTKMALFYGGRCFPMNTLKDLLNFPHLAFTDRFRLGYTGAYALLIRDWKRLEGIS
ncbi:MAG: hypothetical protein DRO93_13405, partial [Candidatus Thorarchaeota archaeon]